MARKVAALDTRAAALEEGELRRRGLALDQREREIAAEDDLALRATARRPRLAASEPTPAIDSTPSAMQAMNT